MLARAFETSQLGLGTIPATPAVFQKRQAWLSVVDMYDAAAMVQSQSLACPRSRPLGNPEAGLTAKALGIVSVVLLFHPTFLPFLSSCSAVWHNNIAHRTQELS